MRRNLLRGISLLFGFLAPLALASIATAQATEGVSPANAEVIKTLRSAHKLLAEADRDYEGHRAKAAEEVHKAAKELGFRPPRPVTPSTGEPVTPKAHSGQPATHEPQTTSDAQLRQALEILQGVSKQLGSSHPKAAANVNAAISEINTALSIR